MAPDAKKQKLSHTDVLVRGSVNLDEFFTVPHIVHSGETLASSGHSRMMGGKGANQAVAVASAGGTVDLAGHVGYDGDSLRGGLRERGVGVTHLVTDDTLPSGRAIIQLSTSTRDNSIILLPGANHSSKLINLGDPLPYSTLLLQNEIRFMATCETLMDAKHNGLVTIFNPSPMLSKKEALDFPFRRLDWLILNGQEAEDLSIMLEDYRSPSTEIDPDMLPSLDQLQYAERLQSLSGIVVTRGAKGAQAVTFKPARTFTTCPAGVVVGEVVDTTGAGDCFTGFFARLITLQKDSWSVNDTLKSILKVANQAAAMCVEKNGAMKAPSMQQVQERMQEVMKDEEWESVRSRLFETRA